MRIRRASSGLTINAIAGTQVVLLGLDLGESKRPGCLGFAIQREDFTEGERYWMRGTKTFRATDPGLGPGGTISSREHPFQTFQWADYSAKPNHRYVYTVIPLYGTPEHLVEGGALSVEVMTEAEGGATHSVWFNRGAIASQEYARRFQNQAPSAIADNAAYRWLSRGLEEALLAFVARASDATFAIHGAMYEFQWPSVLAALKAASDRGAAVSILYDATPDGDGPVAKNEAAIVAADISPLCRGRANGTLMHNKFLILSHNGQPVAVWTGSTNLTENGLFGHSNLGHLIEDSAIARTYLDYWQQLQGDPTRVRMRQWLGVNNVAPPDPWDQDTTVALSPRTGMALLEWYATIARGGPQPLMMTFAFGMDKRFKEVYKLDDGILRIALLEKEGNGRGLAQGKIDIARIRRLPNVVMAIGNNIALNSFDRWLKERSKLSHEVHVRYVHTKYMLIDPLGPEPVVVTGSANFSGASTNTNDENMVIIRNDARVADIYVGEFMRLYTHYAFREAVKNSMERGEAPEDWRPSDLMDDDTWQEDYYAPGHSRYLRRRYFAGA